jgi:hypothetical protein
MHEGAVLEFRRSRSGSYVYAIGAALWVLIGALRLHQREFIEFALYLVLAALFGVSAVLWYQPYARVSQESLTLKLAPIRPRTVMPWSSIQGARRKGANLVELTLLDGKTVKLHLDAVDAAQRDALVLSLQERLGPLPVA